jgi:LysM repeat protein
MKRLLPLWLLALIMLAGCTPSTGTLQPAPQVDLQPYITLTPVTLTPVVFPATASPVPSQTPFIYSIARGDTLSLLAQRFGVSLEALLAANPGLAPQAMSVGQKINIPAQGQVFSSAPISTPVPLEINPTACLSTGDGTVCLVPVRNPYPQALENVKIQVLLLDQAGQSLGSQEAILPLNILAPGQALPAAAFFPGIGGNNNAQSSLITAVRLTMADDRYQRAELQNMLVKIAWDGYSANLQGQISLPQAAQPATRVWLAAVAYDASGRMVGYRRWEAAETLQPGGLLPFELNVYSLGPPIERVDVQLEAARGAPAQ